MAEMSGTETLEGVVLTGRPPRDDVNAAFTPGTGLAPRPAAAPARRGGWLPAVRTCHTCGAVLAKGRRAYCSDDHRRLDPSRREAVTCQLAGCGAPLPPGRRRFCSDDHRKAAAYAGRRRAREADGGAEMIRAAARMLARTSGRTNGLDVYTLGVLWNMQDDLETAVFAAITGLRAKGFTWEEIGEQMGGTGKQAASQWYARHERLYHPRPALEA